MYADFLLEAMKQHSQDTALIYQKHPYNYGDILAEYAKWDKKLVGLKNGSVVGVKGEFNARSIGLILLLINRNCIYVPLSFSLKNTEKYLHISNCEMLIDLSEEQETMEQLSVDKFHDILMGLKTEKKPGLILFSSGTTGDPKATVHDLAPMLEKYKKHGKKISSIAFLLFDHIGGFNTVFYNMAHGGLLVSLDVRSVEEVLSYVQEYQVELLPTTPSFLNMILISKAYEKYDLSSLKIISYGTEPMAQSTLDRFHEIFPNIRLKQTYGLSEVGIIRTQSKDDNSLWMKLNSNEEHQFSIRDDVLWIKSPMSMLGYLNAPSPFDENGWFNTKDLVEQDGDYVKILGRKSDLINVGGQKVYPNEVESCILAMDGVADCIVKGEKNALMGSIVVCYVKINDDLSEKEMKKKIKTYTRKNLEKFKQPIKIYFNQEMFTTSRFKRKR